VRRRETRRWLVAVGLGWLAAAGIATMPAAKADPELSHAQIAYVQTYHSAVCKTIAKYPTEGGVAGGCGEHRECVCGCLVPRMVAFVAGHR
jgi:hypothetical protein